MSRMANRASELQVPSTYIRRRLYLTPPQVASTGRLLRYPPEFFLVQGAARNRRMFQTMTWKQAQWWAAVQ